MVATLEWKVGSLWLGKVEVARTEWRAHHGHSYRIAGHDWSPPYERATDAQQDAESEVRSMLKDAGVSL